jgi:hypothetical protein
MFELPSYAITIGASQMTLANVYVNVNSVHSDNLGNFTVTMNVWDSATSATPGSGIATIDQQTFGIVVTPQIANSVLNALVTSPNPALVSFLTNATIA